MSDDLHYLRSILGQLREVQKSLDHGPSLGGEVLADNINWLDCYIDSLERSPEGERNAAEQIAALVSAETDRMRTAIEGAVMAKTRLDDFADKANAGQIHYSARELKRKIGAAFADFDSAADQQTGDGK